MKLTADFALRFLHFLDTLESFILFLNFFGVVSEFKKFLEKFVSCAPTHCNKGNVIVDFRGKERFLSHCSARKPQQLLNLTEICQFGSCSPFLKFVIK